MDKIYCITNRINGKKYIGYTTRPIEERINEHFAPSSHKSGYAIHKAIKKYGKENFDYCILYEGKNALEKEDHFIKLLNCEYNMTPGGNKPPNQLGNKWNLTEETKQKMRKPKMPRTKKHSQNLSESLKGKIPWNKGKIGVQKSPWKGKRNSPMTRSWKITKNNKTIIIENLALWCDNNGYNKNTVKYHYYNNLWPYEEIQKIEKVK
jgi:group I intron endonuclease